MTFGTAGSDAAFKKRYNYSQVLMGLEPTELPEGVFADGGYVNCVPNGSPWIDGDMNYGGMVSDPGTIAAFQELVKAWAWDSYLGRSNDPQAKAAYLDAIARAAYKGGSGGIDCGAFVSALMRESGWDPNYAAGNTSVQASYLSKNWHALGNGSSINAGQLKPGDVAIRDGHVFVYVGDIPGFDSNIASASLGTRAPMAGREAINDSRLTWYRR